MVERYPLAQGAEAFDAMLAGKLRFRGVLTMD
jgi:D-arabinose 1-dehydrogenase-like Zn-dependent alcohol dehydrogenase